MNHPVKEFIWFDAPPSTTAAQQQKEKEKSQARYRFIDDAAKRLKTLASLIRAARRNFRRTGGDGWETLQRLETEQSALRMEYLYGPHSEFATKLAQRRDTEIAHARWKITAFGCRTELWFTFGRRLFRLLRRCAFQRKIRARVLAKLAITRSPAFCGLPAEVVRDIGQVWL